MPQAEEASFFLSEGLHSLSVELTGYDFDAKPQDGKCSKCYIYTHITMTCPLMYR